MTRPPPKERSQTRAGRAARLPPTEPSASDGDAAARILREAERVFLDFGYVRFTMDQLALELGMSKKTLYKHYVSKEDLLSKVLDARSQRIREEMEALLSKDDENFERKMVTFVAYAVDRFAEVSEPFLHDVRRSAPELFRKIESFREQAIPHHVERLLSQGVTAGVVRKDFPLPVVASMLVHAAQNMLLPRSGRSKMLMPPGELMDLLVRIVCEGMFIRPKESPRAPKPRR